MNIWGSTPIIAFRFGAIFRNTCLALSAWGQNSVRLIPGEQVESTAPNVSRLTKTCCEPIPTDIVCAGIGENGHLAFNDPPVADFHDPVMVKVVRLDRSLPRAAAQRRLLRTDLDDVLTHAYTLTMPALLMRAPVVSVVVPGPRKANAVLTTLRGPISESCPASALRQAPRSARLYLDREAARLVL